MLSIFDSISGIFGLTFHMKYSGDLNNNKRPKWYCNDPNTRQVKYSNGRKLSDHHMMESSNNIQNGFWNGIQNTYNVQNQIGFELNFRPHSKIWKRKSSLQILLVFGRTKFGSLLYYDMCPIQISRLNNCFFILWKYDFSQYD